MLLGYMEGKCSNIEFRSQVVGYQILLVKNDTVLNTSFGILYAHIGCSIFIQVVL